MSNDPSRDPAFEALYRAEFPRLVRSLAPGFGAAAAADAVQEAFIKAGLRWTRVARLESPGGWVRRVALHGLLNERRNAKRRSEILAAIRPTLNPVDVAPDREVELDDAFATLSPQRRAAICLYYRGEYSIAEIADQLTVTTGTVKRYLHDARDQLRNEITEARHE